MMWMPLRISSCKEQGILLRGQGLGVWRAEAALVEAAKRGEILRKLWSLLLFYRHSCSRLGNMYECPWWPCSGGGRRGEGRYGGGDVVFPSRAEASQGEKVLFNSKVDVLACERNLIISSFSFRIPLLSDADVCGDSRWIFVISRLNYLINLY